MILILYHNQINMDHSCYLFLWLSIERTHRDTGEKTYLYINKDKDKVKLKK